MRKIDLRQKHVKQNALFLIGICVVNYLIVLVFAISIIPDNVPEELLGFIYIGIVPFGAIALG